MLRSTIRSIRWNLSDRSRRIMGWRWCEEQDVKVLRKILDDAKAKRAGKNTADFIREALLEAKGAARK